MPKFNVTRHVPFTVDQVFHVASDVANYREFLPLVKRSVVLGRAKLPDGRESFDSELHIIYKKLSIHEVMQSRVTVDPVRKIVMSDSSQGPVKHLNAEWRIAPAPQGGSDINFAVDYEMKSRALQYILSGMFDMAVRRIMTAFEDRARALYGAEVASR
jgi:coenzyme Q-binding protein COQ10